MNKNKHILHWILPHHTNNQRARFLHPSMIAVVIVGILVIQTVFHEIGRTNPKILGYASQIPAQEIIRLTNIQREKKGLSLLISDQKLEQAAREKAKDMFAKDYWAHVSPIGTQPWSFITNAQYIYRYAGENLARDFSDPNSVVQAWMDSPSHRENLLNGRYEDIGVAVVDGKLGGRETTLVVQMFGTKLSSTTKQNSNPTTVSVKALETESSQESAKPQLVFNNFSFSKYFAIGVLSLFSLLFILDITVINRKNISRWTSKSLAHLIFIVAIIGATLVVLRGQII